MKHIKGGFLKSVWRLTADYWHSEEKWTARGLLAAIISLSLGHVYVMVLLNQWKNTFYNTLQNRDQAGFFRALEDFTLLAAIYIIVAVYEVYLRQMLEIRWRKWLTESYLKHWLEKRTYYLMQLVENATDNPDQRISEDVKLFVSYTLSICLGLLKATVTLVSFIAILWSLSGSISVPLGGKHLVIPGYMVWVAIIYSFVGTWLTHKIGRPLVNLNFNQQRYEADFRFSLVRLRENSESIAFYNGEQQENGNFQFRFKKVFKNFWDLMQRQKKLTWFTSGYGQLAIIFPIFVAAPRYFSNQMQLGGLLQTSSAFGEVQDALSFFVNSYSSVAEWRAVVSRLTGFVASMEAAQQLPQQGGLQVVQKADRQVKVAQLAVGLPNGKQLLQGLNLTIQEGDTLLIAGPSGCGKSTLMRTLAGMWPYGQGQISIPREEKIMFLPQKSYLPLGTLREVLLYPYGDASLSEAAIQDVMKMCNLADLTGQLDKAEDWSHIFSLGEQQRIAFARVLLQRPQWLFLDEATSALDEPTEQKLYQLLKEQLVHTAIISVGHRTTLGRYHDRKLTIAEDSSWHLSYTHDKP